MKRRLRIIKDQLSGRDKMYKNLTFLGSDDVVGATLKDIIEDRRFLRDANLNGKNFSKQNFKSGVFIACSFDRSVIKKGVFDYSVFARSSFLDADMSGISAKRCSFSWAKLIRANATDSNFDYSFMDHVDASGADFSGGSARFVLFRNARLCGARFDGTDVTGSDFTDADTHNADFSKAIGVEHAIGLDLLTNVSKVHKKVR